MCVRARLVTGVWPVLREKLHRCEHTIVLRQPFNGFIIRQYYNNKFVASVDFDFEWLASKIIFTPIHISRSKFPNLLRLVAKKARATFSKLETGQRFDDFCVPRIYRYLFISFSISKMS